VITIAQFDSKADIVRQKKANVLVDDGPANIADVILRGIHGIWFECPANKIIFNQIMSGARENYFTGYFWKFDPNLLREKAIFANSWKQIPNVVNSLKTR
jgi:hypothetical protein